MQPGQISILSILGSAANASAGASPSAPVNGTAASAVTSEFNQLLASLAGHTDSALPAAINRAALPGATNGNAQPVLADGMAALAPQLAQDMTSGQSGDAPVTDASLLLAGQIAAAAPQPQLTAGLDGPAQPIVSAEAPLLDVTAASANTTSSATASSAAAVTAPSPTPATMTAPDQAQAQAQIQTQTPVPPVLAKDSTPTQAKSSASPKLPVQTATAQSAPLPAGQPAMAADPSAATGTTTSSTASPAPTAPVTLVSAAPDSMTAPLPVTGQTMGELPVEPALAGMTDTGTADPADALVQRQLPAQTALAAQSATQDNAKAGMKSTVLDKLPTQAVPAQASVPAPAVTNPVAAEQAGALNPAQALAQAAQAQPQAIAQAQTNGQAGSATTSVQAEMPALKQPGLKEPADTRAILQPRGASAMAAGQSASNTQSATPSPSASAAAKPDTTAAMSTTMTSGAEPSLPVQRELPVTAQPLTLQASLNQTTGLTPAPVLGQGENADMTATTDIDLQTGRMLDARVAADRNGAHLPRFAAHTTQHLAGQISRKVSDGNRVFDIRLDPAELGKVGVRLEMRADNRVHAVLTAERPDTLMELQRNARELERALNEAGLELGEDGLDFQMQEDGQAAGDDASGENASSMPVFTESDTLSALSEAIEPAAPRSTYGFLLSRREGVDMRV
ncbi:flagellar hook-length control protein FliK [Maricaulis parjimensis]|uniref:flagellar hook-length control protein FliK n=1 Tax=Maricaulis parjimensis TaxID=144023 RepID=UPI001EED9BC0|nr:flagellar hook-length control protein FliK [Maricaulis parjimensis]